MGLYFDFKFFWSNGFFNGKNYRNFDRVYFDKNDNCKLYLWNV